MRKPAAVLILFGIAAAAAAQATEHRKGPDGLEGWLVRETVPTIAEQGPLPVELIIARHGKIVRKLNVNQEIFLWNFIFLSDGKRIAFQHGSLHFNSTCTLMDIKTGRHLEDVDDWQGPPPNAPEWVKALESAPQLH